MKLKPINDFVRQMPRSGIRRIMDNATAEDILHLEVGQPNFRTPEHIIKAGCDAATDEAGRYTRYTPNMGYFSLREAIVEKLKRENGINAKVNNILVTPGASYGIAISLSVLLNQGDEALVPDPGYVNFSMLAPQYGGVVVRYPTEESEEFKPNINAIADRVTPQTKVVVLNSPSNPTGAVCTEEFIEDLMNLAREKNLYILSDETYEHIIFEGKHISVGRFDTEGRVMSLFSFSKSYSMTGWRIGYVVASDEISEVLEKQQEFYASCAPSISQKAAEAALNNPNDCIKGMVEAYRRRRDIVIDILKKHELFSYTPHGAFYILINITKTGMDADGFADRLLKEQRVAVAPGTTFGEIGGRYIRVSMAVDEKVLAEGLERICSFIKSNKR
ncbi:MAG: pyridoxal phosphate-dependent aminotransferase [Candidatus Poribacteria bacterium]